MGSNWERGVNKVTENRKETNKKIEKTWKTGKMSFY
jgi:hypothetical protein